MPRRSTGDGFDSGSANGLVQDVNLGPVFELGGVFAPMRDDRTIFEQVRVDQERGTIVWPGEVDMDPDVLHGPSRPTPVPRSNVGSWMPHNEHASPL